jgi:hypothetical protein
LSYAKQSSLCPTPDRNFPTELEVDEARVTRQSGVSIAWCQRSGADSGVASGSEGGPYWMALLNLRNDNRGDSIPGVTTSVASLQILLETLEKTNYATIGAGQFA